MIISVFDDLYGRFLREAAVCRNSRHGVDEEVVKAPVSGVLHLCNVLQLVIDGFDDSPLPEQHPVRYRHQRTLHVALEFGDELYSVHKEFLEKLLADVSLVADQLAVKEIRKCLVLQRLPVIHIPRRNHEVEQFAHLVADKMELEAEKPSHGAFPALGDAFENLVNVNALVFAHTQRRTVHEADASAFAQEHLLDEDNQWNGYGALQFHISAWKGLLWYVSSSYSQKTCRIHPP